MDLFVKEHPDAPPGLFAWEAAGLRWLTVPGGVPVVEVVAVARDRLTLQRLHTVAPDARAAEDLGSRLATTHDAGAAAFGAPPDGWSGPGWFGPLDDPRPLAVGHVDSWSTMYAELRLRPLAALLPRWAPALDRLADRVAAGAWEDDGTPARVHGDLWNGNVVWTDRGATLIDPAAHGGHRLTDLAMLDLFGLPHLATVLAAYAEHGPLPDGWRDLLGLHQVHPVAMHVVLFGAGYARQLDDLLQRYL